MEVDQGKIHLNYPFMTLITNSVKALLGQQQVNIWKKYILRLFFQCDLISSGS